MLDIIPDDIRDLAASFDARWPPISIADRPIRIDFWVPHDKRDARILDFQKRLANLAAQGVPSQDLSCERNHIARAWFLTVETARASMPPRSEHGVWYTIHGEHGGGWKDDDGRDHVTLVLEYFLRDGRRHLHAWDDYGGDGMVSSL